MAITFYWGSGSPYAWRVMLALEHKHLSYEPRMLSFARGETKTPEYLAINPRGRVPAIVDDGFVLYESAAIVEYLDQRYPESGSPLFPRDARGAAIVRRLVQEVDHYISPLGFRLGMQAFAKKPEERDAAEIASARKAMLDELARIEPLLAEGGFLAGPLGAADFTLYPHLGSQRRMAQKGPEISVLEDIGPNLRAWMSRIEALPFFDRTYPPHWR
jgi:glutathione S-transferase